MPRLLSVELRESIAHEGFANAWLEAMMQLMYQCHHGQRFPCLTQVTKNVAPEINQSITRLLTDKELYSEIHLTYLFCCAEGFWSTW